MVFFSIIIPFYNSRNVIKKCLSSIFKSRYKDFEVISVSDNSDKETINIVRKFNTKLILINKNKGTAYARNLGAEHARGKYIIFVDSDIMIKKNHLSIIKKNILKYPSEVAFQGIYDSKINYKSIVVTYLQLYLCYYTFSKKIAFIKNLNGSFIIIKNLFFKKLKGFDKNFKSSNAEDADFGYKILENQKKIRILRDIKVTHMPQWTFKIFIEKILRIHTGEMKMFLRKQNIKNKITQLNYFPIIISILILFIQLLISLFIFILPLKNFILFNLFLFFLLLLFNFNFLKFITKEKSFSICLKILPLFFIHIYLFIICFFKGFFEYYILNRKY
jgi:glycosyltransferase involved in cell wall biosynthesis